MNRSTLYILATLALLSPICVHAMDSAGPLTLGDFEMGAGTQVGTPQLNLQGLTDL